METVTLEGSEKEGSFKIKISFNSSDVKDKNQLLKLIQQALVRERDKLVLSGN